MEWDFGGNASKSHFRSSVIGRAGATRPGAAPEVDPEEEDDGSGMAWLKKRKAERARKAAEEAEAAAKVTPASPEPEPAQTSKEASPTAEPSTSQAGLMPIPIVGSVRPATPTVTDAMMTETPFDLDEDVTPAKTEVDGAHAESDTDDDDESAEMGGASQLGNARASD
jgi:hypothetical protein